MGGIVSAGGKGVKKCLMVHRPLDKLRVKAFRVIGKESTVWSIACVGIDISYREHYGQVSDILSYLRGNKRDRFIRKDLHGGDVLGGWGLRGSKTLTILVKRRGKLMANEVSRINDDRTRSQVLLYAGEGKHEQRIVGIVTPRRRGFNLRTLKKAFPLTGICRRTK